MTGTPHSTAKVNTFQAIVRSSSPTGVLITEAEYAIIKELRSMLDKGKHLQMLIGFRDSRFLVYYVNPHTTLAGGVDALTGGK